MKHSTRVAKPPTIFHQLHLFPPVEFIFLRTVNYFIVVITSGFILVLSSLAAFLVHLSHILCGLNENKSRS